MAWHRLHRSDFRAADGCREWSVLLCNILYNVPAHQGQGVTMEHDRFHNLHGWKSTLECRSWVRAPLLVLFFLSPLLLSCDVLQPYKLTNTYFTYNVTFRWCCLATSLPSNCLHGQDHDHLETRRGNWNVAWTSGYGDRHSQVLFIVTWHLHHWGMSCTARPEWEKLEETHLDCLVASSPVMAQG